MKFLDFLMEDNRKHPSMKRQYKKKSGAQAVKKPKPRPKTNLWFENPDFWREDLRMEKGDGIKYQEDEEENMYATDLDGENCWGYWDKKKQGGMTFFKSRPFRHYQHRRTMKDMK